MPDPIRDKNVQIEDLHIVVHSNHLGTPAILQG
jgi:hypothetical protein